MKRHTVFMLAAALLVSARAGAADKLENIKLVWKPTASVIKFGGIDPNGLKGSTIQLQVLADAREKADLLGENRENKQVRKVTTQENVPAFVTDKLKKILSDAGLSMVDRDGDFVLSGELQKWFVEEIKSYDGEARIQFAVKNRAGKELWMGVIGGQEGTFGRSYKDENYYEALSNSIVATAVNLLKDPGLRRALGAK
jgi:hypothetical protein